LQDDICGIDVNMGCPMKFSTSGGMGAALMKDLDNAKNIMKALVDRFGHKMSVSCKIRVLGSFEETLNFVLTMQNFAKVHFISIHPRTSAEKSTVPARWYITKQIIESGKVHIPVLGTGDMLSPSDILKFLRFTGADGVLVARGAIHNPNIFK